MDIKLTSSQDVAFNLMKSKNNVCITGPAGVGKSLLISEFIKWIQSTRMENSISITAATGIAATYIGGNTLHSWAGIGLGDDPDLIKKVKRNVWTRQRWMNTDILIIDEISMISGDLLTKLDAIGKDVRCSDLPFGGIQLIVFGDFCQLPPVHVELVGFAFQSPAWNFIKVELNEVMRQSDPVFIEILAAIRIGRELTPAQKDILKSRMFDEDALPAPPIAGLEPTIIDPYRASVAHINMVRLDAVIEANKLLMVGLDQNQITPENFAFHPINQLQTIVFNAEHKINRPLGENQEFLIKTAYDRVPCNKKLYLAVGAQVMLLKNLDVAGGLVNGSRGVVRHIIYMGKSAVGVIVEFIGAKIIPITVNSWDVRVDEKIIITIKQIPLILSYALTSHKAIGATLDYAKINLADCFEYGQFYTMLSRVRSLDGLIITNMDYEKIKVHDKVLKFYNL